MQEVEAIRPRYAGRLVIDLVVPDYYARRPKPCMGGWARRSLNVTPSGRVLPCHAARDHPRPRVLVGARSCAGGDLGGTRRRSRRSAAPTGCRSPAAPATGARSTSAAAAARRWRSPAMRPRPTRPANCRRTTRACWRWPSRVRIGAPRPLRLSRPRPARRRYSHSNSLNAVVALRGL